MACDSSSFLYAAASSALANSPTAERYQDPFPPRFTSNAWVGRPVFFASDSASRSALGRSLYEPTCTTKIGAPLQSDVTSWKPFETGRRDADGSPAGVLAAGAAFAASAFDGAGRTGTGSGARFAALTLSLATAGTVGAGTADVAAAGSAAGLAAGSAAGTGVGARAGDGPFSFRSAKTPTATATPRITATSGPFLRGFVSTISSGSVVSRRASGSELSTYAWAGSGARASSTAPASSRGSTLFRSSPSASAPRRASISSPGPSPATGVGGIGAAASAGGAPPPAPAASGRGADGVFRKTGSSSFSARATSTPSGSDSNPCFTRFSSSAQTCRAILKSVGGSAVVVVPSSRTTSETDGSILRRGRSGSRGGAPVVFRRAAPSP